MTPEERVAYIYKRREQLEQDIHEAELCLGICKRKMAMINGELELLLHAGSDDSGSQQVVPIIPTPRKQREYSRTDESEKVAVIAEFNAGKSASQIARERGRSVVTITTILKRAGVVVESTGAGRGLCPRATEAAKMQNRILRVM